MPRRRSLCCRGPCLLYTSGSFKSGASKSGARAPKGGVTVKPKAKRKPAAPAVSGATVTTRGTKTVVKSSAPAPKVDIEAKIAAGKAAAKSPNTNTR